MWEYGIEFGNSLPGGDRTTRESDDSSNCDISHDGSMPPPRVKKEIFGAFVPGVDRNTKKDGSRLPSGGCTTQGGNLPNSNMLLDGSMPLAKEEKAKPEREIEEVLSAAQITKKSHQWKGWLLDATADARATYLKELSDEECKKIDGYKLHNSISKRLGLRRVNNKFRALYIPSESELLADMFCPLLSEMDYSFAPFLEPNWKDMIVHHPKEIEEVPDGVFIKNEVEPTRIEKSDLLCLTNFQDRLKDLPSDSNITCPRSTVERFRSLNYREQRMLIGHLGKIINDLLQNEHQEGKLLKSRQYRTLMPVLREFLAIHVRESENSIEKVESNRLLRVRLDTIISKPIIIAAVVLGSLIVAANSADTASPSSSPSSGSPTPGPTVSPSTFSPTPFVDVERICASSGCLFCNRDYSCYRCETELLGPTGEFGCYCAGAFSARARCVNQTTYVKRYTRSPVTQGPTSERTERPTRANPTGVFSRAESSSPSTSPSVGPSWLPTHSPTVMPTFGTEITLSPSWSPTNIVQNPTIEASVQSEITFAPTLVSSSWLPTESPSLSFNYSSYPTVSTEVETKSPSSIGFTIGPTSLAPTYIERGGQGSKEGEWFRLSYGWWAVCAVVGSILITSFLLWMRNRSKKKKTEEIGVELADNSL